jgi:ABC-2 type transport system permease protein
LAKVLSQQALLVSATAIGTGLCVLVTWLLFGALPAAAFLTSVLVWLVEACLLIVVMTLLSVLFTSQGGACGVGLGVYFLGRLLSMWPAAASFSPAGLARAAPALLLGEQPPLLWPLLTAVTLAGSLLALTIGVFKQKDI